MAGVRAPNFVIDCVRENKSAFASQAKSVLISSYTTKASFAVFLYGFISSEANATDAVLCVYGDEDEKREWLDVATDIFQTKKSSPRRYNIVDFDARMPVETPLPRTPFIAFAHSTTLEALFPFQRDFDGLSPFTSSAADIEDVAYEYMSDVTDPRAFAMTETPINYKKGYTSEPYSIVWDHVAFSHSALRRSSTVFYLNALSVCLNRFLLDDDSDEADENDVHYYYNVLYASKEEIPNYITHNEDIDEVDALRDARDSMYELIIIDDAVVNFTVVMPADTRVAPSVSNFSHMMCDFNLPAFRSVITWESIQRPCAEYMIDDTSRISVLWIYHQDLAVAARHPDLLSGVYKKSNIQRKTAEETIQEQYAVAKTMLVYLYMWINHARSFYVLCPFVSKAHELHKLKNVRPLHPKDGLASVLKEEDTLVIFDTLFANNEELGLHKTRCKLIFATFCGTTEEDELAKFMCADKQMPEPTLPVPFRISNTPLYHITVDPRRILLQLELTSLIFYDKKGDPYCTLYECMRSSYNHIMKHANRICLEPDQLYSDAIDGLRRYFDDVHVAELTEMYVISDKLMQNASVINDLIHKKLMLEELFAKNKLRSATREMWTAAHKFFRILEMDKPAPVLINQITHRMDIECQHIIEHEVQLLCALDKFLKQKTEKVSIKIKFNGNASLLRRQIDNRPRPPLPTIEGEPSTHQCRHCDQLFDSRHYLRQHVASFHADDDELMVIKRCRLCDVTTIGEYAYMCHMRSDAHREKAGLDPECCYCEVCGQSYSNMTTLRRHMDIMHNPNASVFCPACEISVTDAEMVDHRLSEMHQRHVSGPTQRYCEYCKYKCRAGAEMQTHLETIAHLRHVQAAGGLMPMTLVFNRWYLLLAATEKLIDPNGYFMNIQEREALVGLADAKDVIDDDEEFCNYVTLLCISLVLKPMHRKLFLTPDQRSGMLVVTLNGRTGIVGHFGKGDKRSLIVEMFNNMNALRLGYANIAYAPTGLHSTIVAYAKSLEYRVKRAPLVNSLLGRLGVFNSYCAYKEVTPPTVVLSEAAQLEEDRRVLEEIARYHQEQEDESATIILK